MDKNLKFKGRLRLYFQMPLIFGVLLAITDIITYTIDVTAGILMSVFTLVYLVVFLLMEHFNRPVVMTELVSFATQYGQIQKRLLRDLEMPNALLDEGGRIIWANRAFIQIAGKAKPENKTINSLFPSLTKDKFPGKEEDESEVDFQYEDRDFHAKMKKIPLDEMVANSDVLNWYYTYCKEKNPDFYMVSEVWASETVIADYYGSETPSMFNFDAGTAKGKLVSATRKGDPNILVNAMLKYQQDFSEKNPDYIDAPFLTNHDMGRIANVLVNDPEKIKVAAGLLMTMNGSPFVYYGEEIGMNSSGTKDENKRIPMVWSKMDTTGMTSGPADMDQGIESPFEGADVQEQDEDSILNYYKRALRLRNENPEIARGTIEKIDSLCDGSVAAITKTYDESTIGIVYQLGDSNSFVNIGDTQLADAELVGYLTLKPKEEVRLTQGQLEMPAKSIAIVRLPQQK